MNDKMQRALAQFIPFIMLGVSLAFAIGLFIMFSYLLVWGVLIGGVIWLFALLKNLWFPRKEKHTRKGRIIEHERDN